MQLFSCPKCGSQNVIGERLCQGCGESLQYRCPQCGAIVDTRFTACPKCSAGLYWPIQEQTKALPANKKDVYKEQEGTYREEGIYQEGKQKQKKRSPVLIVCIAVMGFSLLAGFAAYIFSRGVPFITPASSSSVLQSAPATTGVIKITAKELLRAYYANRKAAEGGYKGKILQVTGVVGSMGKNVVGTRFVKLAGDYIEAWRVQCIFDEENESQLTGLTIGQRVIVQGTCGDYLPPDVTLKDCVLVR